MSRKNIIAANWKMNMTPTEAAAFLDPFLSTFSEATAVDIVIAPSFIAMPKASELITPNPAVALSAQNMSHEASGAFTGETSAAMLQDINTDYVILGHSERRSLYGEDDAIINKKVHATLAAELKPILCIGESLEEREGGQLESVLTTQLEGSLADVTTEQMADVVIAYEPVWAIGTGKTATPEQANSMHLVIRNQLAELANEQFATKMRILYGGSVNADNAEELLGQSEIDGALVGGASLKTDQFPGIITAAKG